MFAAISKSISARKSGKLLAGGGGRAAAVGIRAFGRTAPGLPGDLSPPAVLQRHVCITRSTAARPAGVVCGKALLAPRVPQLNSQAFRLIYGPGREATLPRAPLDSPLLCPTLLLQVAGGGGGGSSSFLRALRVFPSTFLPPTISSVHPARMRILSFAQIEVPPFLRAPRITPTNVAKHLFQGLVSEGRKSRGIKCRATFSIGTAQSRESLLR